MGHGVALLYAAMILAGASLGLLWVGRRQAETPRPPSNSTGQAPPAGAGTDEGADAGFPIADYDHLWVTQIVPLLVDLDAEELVVVDARERTGRHRDAILDAVAGEQGARGRRLGP
ncbi:MAG: hypothetical protein ACR2MB_04895, partial [Acidimicrobiales bacterium]